MLSLLPYFNLKLFTQSEPLDPLDHLILSLSLSHSLSLRPVLNSQLLSLFLERKSNELQPFLKRFSLQ